MKRIHRPLAEAVIVNLMAIFNENKKADRVVEQSLKSNKKWGARDRRFIAENTYEVIRWWRLLKFSAEINERKIKDKQLFWQMLGTWFVLSEYDLPDWEEFKGINVTLIGEKKLEAQGIRKIRESIPDWMDEVGLAETPNWEEELKALNQTASVYLRVNSNQISKDELLQNLRKEGLELSEVEGSINALRLEKRRNLRSLKAYTKGQFEIQDAGSQLISEFLEVSPGMKVIDACAGAGGKSLHLATLMKNKGKLIAMDTKALKLKELNKRAIRNKISIINTFPIKKDNIEKMEKTADRLLLDVPCSGLGVLKRNPDAKWKLKASFLEEIKEVQKNILNEYSSMLKLGGKLVYATCSMLKSENEDQVAGFLKNNPSFELEQEKWISPAESGFDGFYMARIVRVDSKLT